ncbi:retrotransposon protein, putative, ty1-copia subclass, partial [Tanacetum coccineum]
TPALHAIRVGRIQKNQKKKLHKALKGNQGKGKAKMGYAPVQAPPFAPKPKNPPTPKKDNPTKDAICHQCGEMGYWRRNCPIYLSELMKKKKLSFPSTCWVYDTGCGTHICITSQSLTGNRELKPGALSLYVGDGHRAAVEAIGDYHSCLPNGFVNRFEDDNSISVFKNNMIYFNAIPRDDIYEIVISSSNTNESSMYPLSLTWTLLSCGSDRRGEYMSQEFLDHLKDHGVIAHRTPPYTPQHNRVSERRNQTLVDMVRSMMSETTLPKSFWDYALESAARILNMVPTKKVEKTSYEVWHGQAPKLSYLKVWGCEALVNRDTLTKPEKLELRSFKCIFVGYPKETMGYTFYNPSENKVFVARNAEFFESNLIDQEASGKIDEPQSDINPICRSSKIKRAPNQICLYIDAEEHELGDLGEPTNYKAALLDPESEKWLAAMNVEMQSMKDKDVWELVELPPNTKIVGHKWLFKKNTDMEGVVHTFKSHIRAIRILIAITAFYDYEIWQMDVKTAFLNGHLSEEVYMTQPEGFVNPKYPNHVCKLKRSIYGLNQASRQWNKRFDDEIKKFSFTQNHDKPCVFQKASGSYVTFLILYVDDILIMGNNIPMLQDVKSYFGKCFAKKDLGEAATNILGINIYRIRCIKEVVRIVNTIAGNVPCSTIVRTHIVYCDNTGAKAIAKDDGVTKVPTKLYGKDDDGEEDNDNVEEEEEPDEYTKVHKTNLLFK